MEYTVTTMNAMNVIPRTNSILLGPAGFNGTDALCRVVKAGVCIRSFA